MIFADFDTKILKRDFLLMRVLPTCIVFFGFMWMVTWSWFSAKNAVIKERESAINFRTHEIEQAISERFRTYEEILRAGAGLFSASDEVERDEWHDFIKNFAIDTRYPGVQAIAYSTLIPASQLKAHTTEIRRSGLTNYKLYPAAKRSLYTSIIFIEPMTKANQAALGYDMYSNPVRRAAMNTARDTGRATISQQVTLIQERENPDPQPGFLMYFPVYDENKPTATVAQRRQAIIGYTYAPFRANDLFGNIFREWQDENFGFRIYDKTHLENGLFYESSRYNPIVSSVHFADSEPIPINNKEFSLSYAVAPTIVSEPLRVRPRSLLYGGTIFSLCVALLVYFILTNRSRSLAYAEERELQQTKDDLLSLASHQLRTPATAVKQYLGMLQQGYGGDLTKEQQRLIDSAYKSNERQISTIKEMLYVARIDAGRMHLQKQKTNLNTLVEEGVREHVGRAAEREQKLKTHIPKRTIHAEVDPEYIRMVLDNLIDNALKYSYPKSQVTIRLQRKGDQAVIHVIDRGVGIPSEAEQKIFKKFSRLPHALSRQTSGSGIGLYLARQIVLLHGGDITFQTNTDGKGTTFSIALPQKSSPAQ